MNRQTNAMALRKIPFLDGRRRHGADHTVPPVLSYRILDVVGLVDSPYVVDQSVIVEDGWGVGHVLEPARSQSEVSVPD
jgi:hypothetical protein